MSGIAALAAVAQAAQRLPGTDQQVGSAAVTPIGSPAGPQVIKSAGGNPIYRFNTPTGTTILRAASPANASRPVFTVQRPGGQQVLTLIRTPQGVAVPVIPPSCQ